MNRHEMIDRIGSSYLTSNIEAGSKAKLEKSLGRAIKHFKLDLRFEDDEFVVLIETKQSFVDAIYADTDFQTEILDFPAGLSVSYMK